MVSDMSSDIFSRVIDYSKFDLIYAGAQKNMGPAGTTLVVVKKEIIGKSGRVIPSYLDYAQHVARTERYFMLSEIDISFVLYSVNFSVFSWKIIPSPLSSFASRFIFLTLYFISTIYSPSKTVMFSA